MNPFGELGVDLSQSELRETAYEILVGACRSSSAGKRLTYVSSSKERSQPQPLTQNSAASKVKKALGLKPKTKKSSGGEDESGESDRKRGGITPGELMRVQMRVSEQTDSRVRRGFLRLSPGSSSSHGFPSYSIPDSSSSSSQSRSRDVQSCGQATELKSFSPPELSVDPELKIKGPVTRLRSKRLQQYLQVLARRQLEVREQDCQSHFFRAISMINEDDGP